MFFFFQAEDGIRDLVRSRGLGDVYKRQALKTGFEQAKYEWVFFTDADLQFNFSELESFLEFTDTYSCLLYTSDAADERSSVDLGGRRIIKKKTNREDD